MEAIRVGDLLVSLVSHALEDASDLLELLRGCSFLTVGVLKRHEDEHQVVIGLLNQAIQELRSSGKVMQLLFAHASFPFSKLVFNCFEVCYELHLGLLLSGNPLDDALCKLVTMRAIHFIGLVSVHRLVGLGSCEVLIRVF